MIFFVWVNESDYREPMELIVNLVSVTIVKLPKCMDSFLFWMQELCRSFCTTLKVKCGLYTH